MQLLRTFAILSLSLSAVQSSGQRAPKPTIVNLLQLGTQDSGLITSADGVGPMIPRRDAPFETTKEQEQDFVRRFNGLMTTLRAFSATYNSGQVIDVKKVKAVRKAWLELEKSGWFRGRTQNENRDSEGLK